MLKTRYKNQWMGILNFLHWNTSRFSKSLLQLIENWTNNVSEIKQFILISKLTLHIEFQMYNGFGDSFYAIYLF